MEGLRSYMLEHGITQTELAKRLGLEQPTVSDWINGHTHPRVETLLKLSEMTGLSVDELLKGRDPIEVVEVPGNGRAIGRKRPN